MLKNSKESKYADKVRDPSLDKSRISEHNLSKISEHNLSIEKRSPSRKPVGIKETKKSPMVKKVPSKKALAVNPSNAHVSKNKNIFSFIQPTKQVVYKKPEEKG